MAEQFIPAAYEWHWSSLAGSVQGVLRQFGLPHASFWVGGVLGESFRVGMPVVGGGEAFEASGYVRRSLVDLEAALGTLGIRATVHERDLSRTRRPMLFERRLRASLGTGHPVVAYGAGYAPGPSGAAGPGVAGSRPPNDRPPRERLPDDGPLGAGASRREFGLLVGYDDARESYRITGPLTEQVGPWLPYAELGRDRARPGWLAVAMTARAKPHPQRAAAQARDAALAAGSPEAMAAWIALLSGDSPINAPGHALRAQGLAAARAEAAQFWSLIAEGAPDLEVVAQAYRRMALALSRLATLFPYPAGGDVQSAGSRSAGAAALRKALDAESEALDRLAASAIPRDVPVRPGERSRGRDA